VKRRILFVLFILLYTFLYSQEVPDYNLLSDDMVAPTTNEEARLNYDQGTNSLKNNNLDEAEKYLLRALELDPYFVDAMDHLGLVYRRQKRYEDAISIYQKSISINEKNYVPYMNLAIVYKLQKRYDDALLEYFKIIDIDKENPESYYGIGQLYYEVALYEECIKYMEIALSKYYEQESLYVFDAGYNLAYAHYYLKNYEEALRYFKFASTYYNTDKTISDKIIELENILSNNEIDE